MWTITSGFNCLHKSHFIGRSVVQLGECLPGTHEHKGGGAHRQSQHWTVEVQEPQVEGQPELHNKANKTTKKNKNKKTKVKKKMP